MELTAYVESIRRHLAAAAEAGGEEARAQAERLFVPLEAAIRLALQDALAAAAEEITCELAPGSVELRIRGREPEFVVNLPPPEPPPDEAERRATALALAEGDEAATARINLRLPEHLKARIDQAAASEGVSINTWLVRATNAVLARSSSSASRPERRSSHGAQRYTGWSR